MKRYHVVHCKPEQARKVQAALDAFNLSQVAAARNKYALVSLGAFTRNGKLIGGIFGDISCWNGMEIHTLWVNKRCRHQGVGTELLWPKPKGWLSLRGPLLLRSILSVFRRLILTRSRVTPTWVLSLVFLKAISVYTSTKNFMTLRTQRYAQTK